MLQQRASQRQWKAAVAALGEAPGFAAILAPLHHTCVAIGELPECQ